MPTIIRFSSSAGPTGPQGSGSPGGRGPRANVQTLALAVAALAAGALLLAFGLVLLAGVAVVGGVVGGGVMLYHRLTGRWPRFLRVSTHVGSLGAPGERGTAATTGLDPSREVFPEVPRRDAGRSLPPAGGGGDRPPNE